MGGTLFFRFQLSSIVQHLCLLDVIKAAKEDPKKQTGKNLSTPTVNMNKNSENA